LVRVPVPRVFAPSLKVTVPVALAGNTDAVRVTLCPNVEVLDDEVSPVVVVTWLTVWVSTGDVLPALFASPAYTAVMEWDAVESPAVGNVAVPLARVAVPRVLAPSLKVTVPVAFAGNTDAVRVMLCPNVEGLADEVSPVVVVAWLIV